MNDDEKLFAAAEKDAKKYGSILSDAKLTVIFLRYIVRLLIVIARRLERNG